VLTVSVLQVGVAWFKTITITSNKLDKLQILDLLKRIAVSVANVAAQLILEHHQTQFPSTIRLTLLTRNSIVVIVSLSYVAVHVDQMLKFTMPAKSL
jgi:hypothetical protein